MDGLQTALDLDCYTSTLQNRTNDELLKAMQEKTRRQFQGNKDIKTKPR
jgi:hypothetical protein